jgi:integrase
MKIGRVSIDKNGKSYRVRFTYPEGTRHEFRIAKATDEGLITATRAAHLINRDIDLGDLDFTYARYSPKHSKRVEKTNKVHKYLKPYCLRHSFITRCIRSGMDIVTVAKLVGSSTEMIMKNYLASQNTTNLVLPKL